MFAFRRALIAPIVFAWIIAAVIATGGDAGATNRAYARPQIVRHPVRVERRNPMLMRARPSAVYAGAVSTIPSILEAPSGAAFNADDGNVYALDSRQSANQTVIVQIAPNGATRLFATLPIANAARIAYDSAVKRLFVTYTQNSPYTGPGIDSIDRNGQVAFIAGGSGFGQLDGSGALASFSANLSGITVDTKNGHLYVDDGDRIRDVSPNGIVKTLTAPNSLGGTYPRGGGVAYSATDDALYVADIGTDSIERVAIATGAVSALVGQCLNESGFLPCDPLQRDGPAARALFGSPTDIVVDPQTKAIYVADSADASIRRLDLAGDVTTLAGNGLAAHLDGNGLGAEFANPFALTLNPLDHSLAVLDIAPNGTTTLPALRRVTTTGLPPPPPNTPIALFDPASLDPELHALDWRRTAHPPATLVYSAADGSVGSIGQVAATGTSTEQIDPLASSGFGAFGGPFGVAYAYDDTQWIFENANLLGHRSLAGVISAVPIGTGIAYSGNSGQLAAAPNGNVWFVIPQTGALGYATPAGSVVTRQIPALGQSSTAAIAFAANGNPWVIAGNQIFEFTTSGNVLIDDYFSANSITEGPDGNIWFSQSDAIGTIRPNNTIVLYPIFAPIPGCSPGQGCSRAISAIATGSDGNLWVTERGAVARLTTAGVFTEFPVLAARSAPSAISPGPDGNIWFLDAGAKKIGRIATHSPW